MQFTKTLFLNRFIRLACCLIASLSATRAMGSQETGQRFQVVVPPKITTQLTAAVFRLQSSVPVAMVTAVTKKSGSINRDTQILQPHDPQYNLSITTIPSDVQLMVLTVCPL
ncbi:MAG: hypothetical protein ABJZ55_02285 [Fuerstiella sp.]